MKKFRIQVNTERKSMKVFKKKKKKKGKKKVKNEK